MLSRPSRNWPKTFKIVEEGTELLKYRKGLWQQTVINLQIETIKTRHNKKYRFIESENMQTDARYLPT